MNNDTLTSDNVMIVDCGGGTVDLMAYSIIATYPILNFKELVVGTGGKCGATYIDRNLHDLMLRRFGFSFIKLAASKWGPGSRFMQSFETVNRDFRGKEEDRPKEIGPLRLDCNDPQLYDEDEYMVKLSCKDLKGLFDPVIKQVVDLRKQQIDAAKKLGHNIDRMILWCEDNVGIQLCRPDYPQAAVVLGAALRGLYGTKPSSTRCRRHYGYERSVKFRSGDSENDAFYDWKRCKGGVSWFIGKGEAVTAATTKTIEL